MTPVEAYDGRTTGQRWDGVLSRLEIADSGKAEARGSRRLPADAGPHGHRYATDAILAVVARQQKTVPTRACTPAASDARIRRRAGTAAASGLRTPAAAPAYAVAGSPLVSSTGRRRFSDNRGSFGGRETTRSASGRLSQNGHSVVTGELGAVPASKVRKRTPESRKYEE
ncbi:hypothetical protein [Streptomyces sp. SID8016]|uniref:hypothetical protein n=1 Tax=Streptomyces sp. SID8016 TaxID=2706098 RepID=UPI001EF35D08